MKSLDSFKSLTDLQVGSKKFKYYNLKKAAQNGLDGTEKLPKSLKVVLENLLRFEDDLSVNKDQILALKEWLKNKKSQLKLLILQQEY
jgi:aconitate hydratase